MEDYFLDHLLDDDDEEVDFFEQERRPYVVRPRVNHFDLWDDMDFKIRFRLDKQTVEDILKMIEPEIRHPTNRNNAVSALSQLLLTLRFYATGTMLIVAGDFLGVSKPSACMIVKRVTRAIARLGNQFIKMPSGGEEITRAHRKFFEIARFPRVVAAIDCTHVKIQAPGGPNNEYFRNRKGFFSLNIQTLASADLKIIDVVARWLGSTHDQTVFNNSRVKFRLESGEFGNSLVIGDSGYRNTKNVATPFLNPATEVQNIYNESIIRMRNTIERQYGVWKRRFPILSLGMRISLLTAQEVIVATAVLHNVAIERGEEEPPLDNGMPEGAQVPHMEWDIPPLGVDDELTARDQLIREYFSNL